MVEYSWNCIQDGCLCRRYRCPQSCACLKTDNTPRQRGIFAVPAELLHLPPGQVRRTARVYNTRNKKERKYAKMENKSKRFLSLLLALVMVIGLMPMGHAHAEESAAWQVAETAATDLGLENVGDSAKFVIVSAVTPTREMIANVGTLSNGYVGLELATRSELDAPAANAIWTITKTEDGYTVSNDGLNVAIKGNHNAILEADAVVQIKQGNNGTDDWVIYANVDGTDYCLNDHDSFSDAFSHGSAMSTYTNLVGARSMLKLYPVTEVVTEPVEGLLAHYTFESGDAANSVTTNETTTATLSGSATVVDLENVTVAGKAMQLDGTGGLQLTDIVNAAESSFSVSLWYKASTTSSNNVNLVQAGTIGGSTGRTILILSPDSKYYTYLTGDNAKTTTGTAVTPTEWQHVIFSYDVENSKAYFFVNGVADSDEGLTLSGTALDTADMIIGRHRNDGEGQFNGLIDEIRVYDRVLTAEEAMIIYDATADNYVAPVEPSVENITLTVDVNDAQRVIDSDSIFGINHRYAFNGYGSFDSETMTMKEEFVELYEAANFGSIRYPGGTISNLFNWKTTIGPVEDRKLQIHGFYNYSGQGGIEPNFGLTEIANFADDVDSEIIYVYSLGRGNAQDAADLVEYLNAEVGTNPNGGIDWAAVRAANGHEAPYNVRYFEIGNEMSQAWGAASDGSGSQGYWLDSTYDASGSKKTAAVAYAEGGVIQYTKQYAVCEEDWNSVASRSDGSANMVRYMRYANVNPKMYDENGNIVDDPSFVAVNEGVQVYVGSTQWTVVESFENSSATDTHCVVDYSTGAIHFGDGVNGAIPASGQQIYVTYSAQRDGFIEISKAIKNTVAAINEAEGTEREANVYGSFETQAFITAMANNDANEWYDGLAIHPYSGSPSGSGDTFYDDAMLRAENNGIANVQHLVDMMPEGKVPVISEYGIYNSTNELVRSQTHAVYIAKVIMEYVRLGSPYIQKHCLVDWYSSGADALGPTQQAVIQAVAGADANTKTGEGTFTFFSTPSAHVFQMLNSGFGDTIVSTEFSTSPTMSNGATCLSALAATDEESNIYVAIVNASRTEDYTLDLALEGISAEGATITAQVLTADTYAAANSPEDPEAVTVQTVDLTGESSYTIPKYTFVVLKIDPVDDLDTSAVVSGFTASQSILPTKGGDVTVSITGRNLPDGIAVKCGDTTVTTSGDSIKQTAVLSLPANTTEEDIVYTIQYSLDGVTFEGDLTVTVAIGVYDPDDDSRDIPIPVLTATAGDSHSGQGPEYVLDEDVSTLWHTNWYGTSRDNHWIQFELSESYTVDGLRYKPRENGSSNGIITEYQIQVSNDGVNFETVASGNWENNSNWKNATFDGQNVKYVRLVAVNAYSDSSYVFASAAEIRLTGVKSDEAPHEHAYTAVVTAPTCTEGGYTTYTCSCGNSYVADETEALGHDWKGTSCQRCDATRENPFTDVPEDSFYIDPVLWAVEKGITTGATETLFDPEGNCLRAAVVTFLWRAAGSPEPTTAENPFSDVTENDFFYKAVLWAVEKGITNGTSATEFSPYKECNRAQVVTFLWRSQGSPDSTAEVTFTDVEEGQFYTTAVAWAVENGITNGMGDGTFGVEGTCNRAQVVTFLYRTLAE